MILSTRRRFAQVLGACLMLPRAATAFQCKALPLAPTYPVRGTRDPLALAFTEAIHSGESLSLYYQGGNSPGVFRRFRPFSLYRLQQTGPIYVVGRCELRNAVRTLRLDRVRLC